MWLVNSDDKSESEWSLRGILCDKFVWIWRNSWVKISIRSYDINYRREWDYVLDVFVTIVDESEESISNGNITTTSEYLIRILLKNIFRRLSLMIQVIILPLITSSKHLHFSTDQTRNSEIRVTLWSEILRSHSTDCIVSILLSES